MNILFPTLADLSRPIGAGIHVRELVRNLRARGHEVELLSAGPPFASSCGPLRRGWHYAKRLLGLTLRTLPSLRRADLVYVRDPTLGCFVLPPSRAARKPLVFEINGLSGVQQRMTGRGLLYTLFASFKDFTEKRTARGALRVISVTEKMKDYLVGPYGVAAEKVVVIPNGVDPSILEKARGIPSEPGDPDIERNGPCVLFVGSLSHWQGVDVLIRAAPAVLRAVPEALFVIAGDGPIREGLESLCAELGVRDRFVFTGFLPHEEIPPLIGSVDVCVALKRELPSGYSPIKVYEYLACGRPVVASLVPGLEEVEEEGAGILVAPEDPKETAGAILRLLEDPELRRRMGDRARCIANRHSWGSVAGRVESVLKEALTSRK